MGYNTRRKSLSLPALGIQVPTTKQPKQTPATKDTKEKDESPVRKLKRSHELLSSPPETPEQTPALDSPKRMRLGSTEKSNLKQESKHVHEYTPPPSPRDTDFEEIDDELVAGVVKQLAATGNRPHFIKDLATILSLSHETVSASANPAALLSSRLASFMKRSWPASSPCIVAKQTIPVHPRKVYYYLTDRPRGEVPSTPLEVPDISLLPLPASMLEQRRSKALPPHGMISPTVSDEADEVEIEERKRSALSPSPEIDLSIDLHNENEPAKDEEYHSPGMASPNRLSFSSTTDSTQRATSAANMAPQLRGDEIDFQATANGMRERAKTEEEARTKSEEPVSRPVPIKTNLPHESDPSLSAVGDKLAGFAVQTPTMPSREDEHDEPARDLFPPPPSASKHAHPNPPVSSPLYSSISLEATFELLRPTEEEIVAREEIDLAKLDEMFLNY